MIIGKFHQQDDVYVGNIPGIALRTGSPHPDRLKGIDYTVTS